MPYNLHLLYPGKEIKQVVEKQIDDQLVQYCENGSGLRRKPGEEYN